MMRQTIVVEVELAAWPDWVLTPEEWRDVPGYEGRYQASSWGRARSLDHVDNQGKRRHGRILKQYQSPNGYHQTTFYNDDGAHPMGFHVAVALAFLGEPPGPGYEVNHIDGDRTNNLPDNLEWVTHSENLRHARKVLNHHPGRRPILTDEQVRQVRQEYTGKYGEIRQLAKKYGTTEKNVFDLVHMRTRRDI